MVPCRDETHFKPCPQNRILGGGGWGGGGGSSFSLDSTC